MVVVFVVLAMVTPSHGLTGLERGHGSSSGSSGNSIVQ